MIRHYIVSAFRRAGHSKLYVALNGAGLALGMACCLVVGIFVAQQTAIDRHHARADQIFRLLSEIPGPGGELVRRNVTAGFAAGLLRSGFPEMG